jgi:hypothetical protein
MRQHKKGKSCKEVYQKLTQCLVHFQEGWLSTELQFTNIHTNKTKKRLPYGSRFIITYYSLLATIYVSPHPRPLLSHLLPLRS